MSYFLVFVTAAGFVSGLLLGLIYAICRLFGWIVFSSDYWKRLALYRQYDEGTGNWKLGLHYAAPLATFLVAAIWIAVSSGLSALAQPAPTNAKGFLVGLLLGLALAVVSLIAGRRRILIIRRSMFFDVFPDDPKIFDLSLE